MSRDPTPRADALRAQREAKFEQMQKLRRELGRPGRCRDQLRAGADGEAITKQNAGGQESEDKA